MGENIWPSGTGIDTSGIEPYIAGTSVPVAAVRGFHVTTHELTADYLREDYPELTTEQALDAAAYFDANFVLFAMWDDLHGPEEDKYWTARVLA